MSWSRSVTTARPNGGCRRKLRRVLGTRLQADVHTRRHAVSQALAFTVTLETDRALGGARRSDRERPCGTARCGRGRSTRPPFGHLFSGRQTEERVRSGCMSPTDKPVAVVVGATSKWQADGRNTLLAHGTELDDSDLPVGIRWGDRRRRRPEVRGRRIPRRPDHPHGLERRRPGGGDPGPGRRGADRGAGPRVGALRSRPRSGASAARSATRACSSTTPATSRAATCRPRWSCSSTSRPSCSTPRSTSPAGARSWSPRRSCRRCGRPGEGTFLISNNAASLRGRKRYTGQSLYYPRVMMRTLAQVLTEEYSEHGVHVANIVIDGLIDSPGPERCRSPRSGPRRR